MRRIARTRRGDYRVRLTDHERQLLRALPGELRELLGSDDPGLVRLFPRAYPDDARASADYDRLVRAELLRGKRESLRVLEETADADRLDEEQLGRWLGAIEDLRLVLGTRLDVREDDSQLLDPSDPDAPARALYGWLSWLQEEVVAALADSLPPPRGA